ncbi:stage III sporulation protein AF [Sporomusa termitida]|uniref:Stage III sporulation protein AF n=1 Tax=Sporomusa termitida TaxID=2377 RepID=A0A517DTY5_9FIRM|nr:stage III sporulation protein AF [Sporomusa termitida]QDR80809.1 stage III sporulation protein AF [Sporomusa termitida]
MIDSVTVWVKSIIYVVLFASFLELLLPNSSMQRFIRVIMGLFILLAILNPIISVLEDRLSADQIPALAQAGSTLSDTEILSAGTQAAGKRNQLVREIYARDLSKQIRAMVMAIDGVANAKVTVAIAETQPGSKEMGKINNVVVYIEPGFAADERKIAKVTIGEKPAEIPKESNKLPPAVINKVNRMVTELYQLKSSQVEVKQIQ